MLSSPPIPSPTRPLSDLETYIFVRRKFLAPKKRQFVRLNGAVLSVHATQSAPIDWEVSILHASIAHSSRRCTLVITLPTASKVFLLIEDRHLYDRWLVALQLAISRDFHSFYALQDKIGEGAFATVNRATCIATGRLVAVKCIKKKDFDMVTARELDREMFAMRHLRHQNIVTAHDVFNTLHQVYIVMDYMPGGTMKDNVQSCGGRIPEHFARPVMHQVLTACAFLHRHGYVHRDVKLENVLCHSSTFPMTCVRIADFGYVNFVEDFRHPCLRSLLGTPVYIAPEIISRKPYSAAVDVYAMGIMLYRMISGHYPYDGDDDDRTLELAAQAHLSFSDPSWRRTSKECRSFVRALLQPHPERRLTAAAALLHPWIANCPDVVDAQNKSTTKKTNISRDKHAPPLFDSDRLMMCSTDAHNVLADKSIVSMSPVTPAFSGEDDFCTKTRVQPPQPLRLASAVGSYMTTNEEKNLERTSSVAEVSGSTTEEIMSDVVCQREIDENENRRKGAIRVQSCPVPRKKGLRSGVDWSTNVEAILRKVRRIALGVRFVTKLSVLAGVRESISTWDTEDNNQGDDQRIDEELNNEDSSRPPDRERDRNGGRVGNGTNEGIGVNALGNIGILTGLVGRAASNHRSERSRWWGGTLGEKVKRTMSMGRRWWQENELAFLKC